MIRFVESRDRDAWFELDRGLPRGGFDAKVRDGQGYVLEEDGQHFWRKLGYGDAGEFAIDVPGYAQPPELIMIKGLEETDCFAKGSD